MVNLIAILIDSVKNLRNEVYNLKNDSKDDSTRIRIKEDLTDLMDLTDHRDYREL